MRSNTTDAPIMLHANIVARSGTMIKIVKMIQNARYESMQQKVYGSVDGEMAEVLGCMLNEDH